MRILVLGGTWFLGRAVVDEALRRGWEVTTFNRGRSGPVPAGVAAVHGDRTSDDDLSALAEHGPWDAVIDTSASELAPRNVLAGARALAHRARHYVFTSTVNAYQGWPNEPLNEDSALLDGPPDADADYGRLPAGWTGPDWYYGRQKAGAERAVRTVFGEDRTTILRPGVVLGPGEYVGRLPWWLRRTGRGGTILAPGDPYRTIQPIDVRDVACFALDQAERGTGDAFNVTAPQDSATMETLLVSCLEATGSTGRLAWVPDDLLIDAGVQQWTELPLWRTSAGVWAVDSGRARNAGLLCRPLAETVFDTWRWLTEGGVAVPHPRADEHGIASGKEADILAKLSSR